MHQTAVQITHLISVSGDIWEEVLVRDLIITYGDYKKKRRSVIGQRCLPDLNPNSALSLDVATYIQLLIGHNKHNGRT